MAGSFWLGVSEAVVHVGAEVGRRFRRGLVREVASEDGDEKPHPLREVLGEPVPPRQVGEAGVFL
jgi:hypothetical protein